TGYRVERCAGAGCASFAQVAALTGTPPVPSAGDSGLSPATSYSYRVRATDRAGNLSGYPNVASATTAAAPDLTPPTPPTGLTPTVVSSTQINLSWTASTDTVGVTGYRVERCAGAGCASFAQVAALTGTPPVPSAGDSGLSPATSYSYRVRATDLAGNLSGYSNVASAATAAAPDLTPPTPPTGLTPTVV